MTGSEERELGVLSAKVEALETQFTQHRLEAKDHRVEVREDMQVIRASLQTVLDRLNGWQGGWKALTVIGAIMTVIGTLIGRFMPYIFKGP